MGDVVLRKGKEEEKSQSQQPPSVLDGLDHGNSQQEGSDEATKAEQPSLCTALSHSANSAIVDGSLFLQNESEFTQMPRMSPENQSNQCKGQ